MPGSAATMFDLGSGPGESDVPRMRIQTTLTFYGRTEAVRAFHVGNLVLTIST